MIANDSVYIVNIDYAMIGVFSSAELAYSCAVEGYKSEFESREDPIVRALTSGGMLSIMFRRNGKLIEIERWTLNTVEEN